MKDLMVSEDSYHKLCMGKCYEHLMKEREVLLKELRHYEKHKSKVKTECTVCPCDETIYLMNLQYLKVLCEVMIQKKKEGKK